MKKKTAMEISDELAIEMPKQIDICDENIMLNRKVEHQQNEIEKLNRVVSILNKNNEKYYQLRELLQDILSD